MTSAEYQQQYAQQGHGNKGKKPGSASPPARTTPAHPTTPPDPTGASSGGETALPAPAYGDVTTGQASWLFAGGTVSLAYATPIAGRQRLVCTSPADEGLRDAVLAAVAAYCSTSVTR